MRRLCVLSVLFLAACAVEMRAPVYEGSDAGTADSGSDAGAVVAPVTTANPAGRKNVGPLNVTLTCDRAANITYTQDGSDPTNSDSAVTGESPVTVTLVPPGKITLRFFAKDAAGVAETPKSESYELLEATTPASITGTIITHELISDSTAHVGIALYSKDPRQAGDQQPVEISTFSAGLPGGAKYKFEGLPAGRYWAVAYWWPGDAMGDPQLISFAQKNPIDLDPAVGEKQRADFVDLFLGKCDPQGTGVDGEVVVASSIQNHATAVVAYRKTLAVGNLQDPSAAAFAPGLGERRPFALCNLDPGTVNLMAGLSQRDTKNPTDLITSSLNPISVSVLTHTTLYLEAPAPGLASISGSIHLSGPLPGGSVTVLVSSEPWSEQAKLVAAATVLTTNSMNYIYNVTGLAPGTYYVTAITTAGDGSQATTKKDAAIVVSGPTSTPIVGLDIPVGRVSGTIEVNDARSNASSDPLTGDVAILITRVGDSDPLAYGQATLAAPDASGLRYATYSVFGLPDDSFRSVALIRLTSDTTWETAFQRQHYAPAPGNMLPLFTIAGGSTATVNFSRLFQ